MRECTEIDKEVIGFVDDPYQQLTELIGTNAIVPSSSSYSPPSPAIVLSDSQFSTTQQGVSWVIEQIKKNASDSQKLKELVTSNGNKGKDAIVYDITLKHILMRNISSIDTNNCYMDLHIAACRGVGDPVDTKKYKTFWAGRGGETHRNALKQLQTVVVRLRSNSSEKEEILSQSLGKPDTTGKNSVSSHLYSLLISNGELVLNHKKTNYSKNASVSSLAQFPYLGLLDLNLLATFESITEDNQKVLPVDIQRANIKNKAGMLLLAIGDFIRGYAQYLNIGKSITPKNSSTGKGGANKYINPTGKAYPDGNTKNIMLRRMASALWYRIYGINSLNMYTSDEILPTPYVEHPKWQYDENGPFVPFAPIWFGHPHVYELFRFIIALDSKQFALFENPTTSERKKTVDELRDIVDAIADPDELLAREPYGYVIVKVAGYLLAECKKHK